eukprot:2597107-Rhodomonas_salina.1
MPENRLLYRGLHGVRLDKEHVKNRSFVEFGFSSATPDKKVALDYSKGTRSDLCTLLEIEVGQVATPPHTPSANCQRRAGLSRFSFPCDACADPAG